MRSVYKCLILLMLCLVTSVTYSQIPVKAADYRLAIQNEIEEYFPDIPYREYVPALIEKESCITLNHRTCFSSLAELKTKRELGKGFGQITIAYNEDGSVRFDKLGEMKTRYKKELGDVDWKNIGLRPDAQIRIIVLMLRDDYGKLYDIADEYQRMSMVDAAYNGGSGSVNKERRICGLTKGCDPDVWFDNVESHCSKSKKPMAAYGNRSICEIHRDHVRSVMKVKLPKYIKANYFLM